VLIMTIVRKYIPSYTGISSSCSAVVVVQIWISVDYVPNVAALPY
jgi:hypothetical protein